MPLAFAAAAIDCSWAKVFGAVLNPSDESVFGSETQIRVFVSSGSP